MDSTQPLGSRQPLASMSPMERRAIYGGGMYSPNEDIRTDADAFEIRNDVCVEDACWTALRLMRMAVAQLELLGSSDDLAPTYRDVIDGTSQLGRLACGTIALVHSALRPESSTESQRASP